jgi:hypothetical protein
MRLDDDPDITLEEMLVFARGFQFPLLPPTVSALGDALAVPQPRQIRLPDTPLVVPDACLRLVDGPLVGL